MNNTLYGLKAIRTRKRIPPDKQEVSPELFAKWNEKFKDQPIVEEVVRIMTGPHVGQWISKGAFSGDCLTDRKDDAEGAKSAEEGWEESVISNIEIIQIEVEL